MNEPQESKAPLASLARTIELRGGQADPEATMVTLVHNELSAIGAAPHLARPNLPQPARHYPAGVQLAVMPFGELALRHFIFLELFRLSGCRPRAPRIAKGRAAIRFRRTPRREEHKWRTAA